MVTKIIIRPKTTPEGLHWQVTFSYDQEPDWSTEIQSLKELSRCEEMGACQAPLNFWRFTEAHSGLMADQD